MIRPAFIPLTLLVGCLGAGAETPLELPLTPGGVVMIEIDFGDGFRPDRGAVRVSAHDAPDVRVHLDTSGWGSAGVVASLEPRPPRDARLEVRVTGATAWMFGGPRIQVDVRIPRGSTVDLRSIGGPVRIEHVEGSVRARTHAAGIELHDVEGPVKLRAIDGPVEVSDVRGRVDVSCTGGSIEVDQIRGDVSARTTSGAIDIARGSGRVKAKSLDGDVSIDDVRGPVQARSESGTLRIDFATAPSGHVESEAGNVEAVIPTDAAAQLEARALRGRVELGPGLVFEGDSGPRYAEGRFGAGGPLLVLRSSDGDVRLTGRPPVAVDEDTR